MFSAFDKCFVNNVKTIKSIFFNHCNYNETLCHKSENSSVFKIWKSFLKKIAVT